MRKKEAEQREARRLRAEGWSLRRIARELGVSLSSASIWVRDVELPEPEEEQLAAEERPLTGVVRRCGKCRQDLDTSAFNRAGDGYQHWCRECYGQYFRNRGDVHRQQSAAAKKIRYQRARKFIKGFLGSRRCADCGTNYMPLLECDHIGPKRADVNRLVFEGASVERIEDELRNCEIVCVNCHRRRTALRAGSWRLHPECLEERTWRTPCEERNMVLVRDHLMSSCCIDCGENDLVVLDFDHVGKKTGSVIRMAIRGCSLSRLEAEISQCEVRCANCHRARTREVLAGDPFA